MAGRTIHDLLNPGMYFVHRLNELNQALTCHVLGKTLLMPIDVLT